MIYAKSCSKDNRLMGKMLLGPALKKFASDSFKKKIEI